jgi:hypothetical protein
VITGGGVGLDDGARVRIAAASSEDKEADKPEADDKK